MWERLVEGPSLAALMGPICRQHLRITPPGLAESRRAATVRQATA